MAVRGDCTARLKMSCFLHEIEKMGSTGVSFSAIKLISSVVKFGQLFQHGWSQQFNFYGGKQNRIKGEFDLPHRRDMVFYTDYAMIMILPKPCPCSMVAFTLQVTVSKYIRLFHTLVVWWITVYCKPPGNHTLNQNFIKFFSSRMYGIFKLR